eukprot:535912_1
MNGVANSDLRRHSQPILFDGRGGSPPFANKEDRRKSAPTLRPFVYDTNGFPDIDDDMKQPQFEPKVVKIVHLSDDDDDDEKHLDDEENESADDDEISSIE